MATIQATNVSGMTQGAIIQPTGFTQAFRPNPLLMVAAKIGMVGQGATSLKHVAIGQFTAAAVSENAAITGSAIPTVDTDNATLASGGISYELTSEAMHSVVYIDDLMAKFDQRALEAVAEYIASDSSVGIAALIASLSAYGTSGATLTFNTCRLARRAVANSVGDNEMLCIIDGKGVDDVTRSLESSGATGYANQAMAPLIETMFTEGALPNSIGFTGVRYGGINFFQTNNGSTGLYTTGGDTYGILMVPPTDQLSGMQINPAICLDFSDNPIMARRDLANKSEVIKYMGVVPIGKWIGEPNTSNADAARYSYKTTFDSFLHNAGAAAAVRYVTA